MKLKIHFNHKEELWNSWSHAGGILMGFVCGSHLLILVLYRCITDGLRRELSSICFGMLMSYIASTVYHAVSAWSKWKERLRKWTMPPSTGILPVLTRQSRSLRCETRDIGDGALFIFIWACAIAWNHHEFCQTQGSQQPGDHLLCRHGIVGTGCL